MFSSRLTDKSTESSWLISPLINKKLVNKCCCRYYSLNLVDCIGRSSKPISWPRYRPTHMIFGTVVVINKPRGGGFFFFFSGGASNFFLVISLKLQCIWVDCRYVLEIRTSLFYLFLLKLLKFKSSENIRLCLFGFFFFIAQQNFKAHVAPVEVHGCEGLSL